MIASGQWQSLFLSHIQPFGLLWAIPFYFFSTDWAATIILIFQAAVLVLPVIGLYRHFGIIPALAFSFYFPLWYNALFDFHIDHIAIPILFGFFFFERNGKLLHAFFLGVLLAFVKEPFAIQTAFCGLYLCATRKNYLCGLLLTLFGIVYFTLASQYFIDYFRSPYINIETSILNGSYGWLGNNIQEMIKSIATKPYFIFIEILANQDKVKYFLYLFGALGFIPFLRPIFLLPAIPILFFSLLSNNPEHYSYNTHYTAGLIAPIIIAFSEGLPTAKKIWGKTTFPNHLFIPSLVCGLLICHILVAPSPISRKFFIEKSWFYHYSVYLPSKRSNMIKSALMKHIPTNPETVISIQNSLNAGNFSKHKNIFIFPHAATEKRPIANISKLSWSGFLNYTKNKELKKEVTTSVWADYVILDLKKPWFIVAQSCHWIRGECFEDKQGFSNKFSNLVKTTEEQFYIIYKNDGFMILKNRSDQTK